jgi:hypothetical protein
MCERGRLPGSRRFTGWQASCRLRFVPAKWKRSVLVVHCEAGALLLYHGAGVTL